MVGPLLKTLPTSFDNSAQNDTAARPRANIPAGLAAEKCETTPESPQTGQNAVAALPESQNTEKTAGSNFSYAVKDFSVHSDKKKQKPCSDRKFIRVGEGKMP
jgi:hypothetical protein